MQNFEGKSFLILDKSLNEIFAFPFWGVRGGGGGRRVGFFSRSFSTVRYMYDGLEINDISLRYQ